MIEESDFARYLSAKKTVDDRALNGHVWQVFVENLPAKRPLRVLEVGCGSGAMLERLAERGALPDDVEYTAVDIDPANVQVAQERAAALPPGWTVEFEAADVFAFAERERGRRVWDVLIAHAFLDLVPLDTALPQLFDLLASRGLVYFTINFDGETILQPVIDVVFDQRVLALYHRTMDERLVDGRPSGHSHTGRRLFAHLPAAGAEILAAGGSDWVVFGGPDGYPASEAAFLHFIVDTIGGALHGHPELERHLFAAWIAQRHAQIDAGTLVYIAHQLDFCGRLKV